MQMTLYLKTFKNRHVSLQEIKKLFIVNVQLLGCRYHTSSVKITKSVQIH